MKAAVVYQKGDLPRYAEVPEPVPENDQQVLITVKAAAIKHFDKSNARGTHYSAATHQLPAKIIGGDGVGILEDGRRVFALGAAMIAEKAIVDKSRIVLLPDAIDSASAAALPNAIAGSAMALRFRAAMQKGATVLINGATSFTGKVAVQVARHYGAKKIIVTGRNAQSLQSLKQLGADEMVALSDDDNGFIAKIKTIHAATPIDIIIDYLWGHSAELILGSLKGDGSFTHQTRFVSVGSVTGDTIQLSAENLRSVDLQLSGSGLGSWTREEMGILFSEILPEMFQLAAEKKLVVETEIINLKDIESLWQMSLPSAKRLVVSI